MMFSKKFNLKCLHLGIKVLVFFNLEQELVQEALFFGPKRTVPTPRIPIIVLILPFELGQS